MGLGSEPGTFDRTLSISGAVDLDVRSDAGGIIITAGSSASIRVHGVLKPRYGRFDLQMAQANIRALEQNPPIEQVGNRIRIGYVNDPQLLRGVTVRLEIETPRTAQVHAHAISGGIRINGIDGPIETETSSGQTEIADVAEAVKASGRSGGIFIRNSGPVSVRTKSGGIQLFSIHGSVEAVTTSGRTEISDVSDGVHSTTRSGSISIDNATGSVVANNTSGSIDAFQLTGSVHAQTKSGAIRISQISPAPIRALADSGAIEVELADQRGYLIDAQSDSGRVSGPVTDNLERRRESHRLKGQIGVGGPLVDLDTHSSRIVIN